MGRSLSDNAANAIKTRIKAQDIKRKKDIGGGAAREASHPRIGQKQPKAEGAKYDKKQHPNNQTSNP
jgi:hypothetical protein